MLRSQKPEHRTYLDLHGRERVSDNGQKVGKREKKQDIISDKHQKLLTFTLEGLKNLYPDHENSSCVI